MLKFQSRAEFSKAATEVELNTEKGEEYLSSSMEEPIIIGWTGSPGAGKSSLISSIVNFRRQKYSEKGIGIIALDPSSPKSGGAMLGDRIRMEELMLDEKVFIRSIASRNSIDGISLTALRVARFLASCGYNEIHIETVGAGQNDIGISNIADTTVVVSAPNMGDAIQALKAGILEIADILCANKSDLIGADRNLTALELSVDETNSDWVPKLVSTSVKENRGIEELSDIIDEHGKYLNESGKRREHIMMRRKYEFEETVKLILLQNVKVGKEYRATLENVVRGNISPSEAAKELISEVM